jgi:response regulator RpfG family c-di-GMP phosphodiesterase
MLLTGYADIGQAIEVVNKGSIFRFLTKPCPPELLTTALDAALAQYRLVTAEKNLLDRTLRGSVQVLGEVLALVNPTAFGRAVRVQRLVRELAGRVAGAGAWEVDVAAVLSQLGCVTLPEAVLTASVRGAALGADEQRQLDALPAVTRNLLRPIPRLERVTEIIAYLDRPFDAPPTLPLEKFGKDTPVGARLLKVGFDFDALVARGVPRAQALDHLRSRVGRYDPDILSALADLIHQQDEPECREVAVADLAGGMITVEDLHSTAGVLLLGRHSPITEPLKLRLEALAARGQIPARLRVLVPSSGRCS